MTSFIIIFHLIAAIYYLILIVKLKRQKVMNLDEILLKQVKYTNKGFFKEIDRWSTATSAWAMRDDVTKSDLINVLLGVAEDARKNYREFEGEEILEKIEA